jgi:hypothetical protein
LGQQQIIIDAEGCRKQDLMMHVVRLREAAHRLRKAGTTAPTTS